MPIYSYTCLKCDTNIERMCLIENRNNQFCVNCGYRLAREVDKPGMVWSPTKNGGYST